MCRAFGATLHVLHVFEPLWITSADVVGGGVSLATMIQGLEDTARKQLEATVTEDDRRELKATAVFVSSESPAREIAKYAGFCAQEFGAEVHLPFGGVKETGNGHREAGHAALDTYTEWKSVYVDFSGRLQRAQIDNQPG